jgi:spectinomycin phosphotransferase
LIDPDSQAHFITVDDLDNKDWMADTREAAWNGLRRALGTAAALRYSRDLDFVVAPIAACDGQLVWRLDRRYAVSVFPFVTGQSIPFGSYPDPLLRDRVLDMIVALHRSTPGVRRRAPRLALRFGGQRDVAAFLDDPLSPWTGGPFSEPSHRLLADHATDLTHLVAAFHRLAELTATDRTNTVITHGEPHPANLVFGGGQLKLVDWDTAALAPPERDLSVLTTTEGDGVERYQEATGHQINRAVITLYQLRWYLDDLASAIRLFRHPHDDTADTRLWWEGLAPRLQDLPTWLAQVT